MLERGCVGHLANTIQRLNPSSSILLCRRHSGQRYRHLRRTGNPTHRPNRAEQHVTVSFCFRSSIWKTTSNPGVFNIPVLVRTPEIECNHHNCMMLLSKGRDPLNQKIVWSLLWAFHNAQTHTHAQQHMWVSLHTHMHTCTLNTRMHTYQTHTRSIDYTYLTWIYVRFCFVYSSPLGVRLSIAAASHSTNPCSFRFEPLPVFVISLASSIAQAAAAASKALSPAIVQGEQYEHRL